jgi:hypothetical protein
MTHDEWLDRWFDGDLSTAELPQFEAALRADDLLRRSLVERSLLEAGLIDTLAGTGRAAAPRRRFRPTPSSAWKPFAVAAALLVAVAALVVGLRSRPPADPGIVRRPDPPPPTERESREAELKALEARQVEIEKRKAPDDADALRKWEAEIAKIKAEREARQRELDEIRRKERETAPKPPDPPVPPPPTQAAIARVTAAEEAVLVKEGSRLPVRAGYDILPGDGLEGALTIDFPAGARVETSPGTAIRVEPDRLDLPRGTLSATGKLAVTTPHGELTLDGRTLVAVDATTRVEVSEGTAKLKRRDGKNVQIKAGFTADSSELALKPIPKEEAVLRFDFEDGKRPASLLEGEVGRGPGGRLVLNGVERRERGTLRRQVAIENKQGLFTVADGMVLRFDCWMKGGAGSLSIYFWDATQKENLFVVLPGVREGGWTKVAAKLSDFKVEGDSSRGFKSGDTVCNLLISLFDEQPASLHLDNLEVVRPRR